MTPSGIAPENRARLERLHRAFPGPFGVAPAAEVLDLPPERAGRLLADLAARGWLARVRRGMYTTVPLGADDPATWRADPWVVATQLWSPCYLAGWTALSHWELTEQLFQVTVVRSARHLRGVEQVIQGMRYLVTRLPADMHFGTHVVWRERCKTLVSDPSRTIVDVLADPRLGGGIRHVADCLAEYLESEHHDEDRLVDYALRLQNRTVFKRLGHLIEARVLGADALVERCLEEMSAGLSPLDPTVGSQGRIQKRWNLRVTVAV